MKKALCIILLLIFQNKAQAQAFNAQDAQLLSYNVAFGAVSAGIGGIINKDRGTKWHKAFLKSFWQGAVGGTFSYSGKKLNTLITKYKAPGFGWPAKIVHAAGSSIIYSAALNKEFLKYWSIDYGPARFDISLRDDQTLKLRFLPGSIGSFISAAQYGRLDIGVSLACGNIAFKSDNYSTLGIYTIQGLAFNHAFMYVNNSEKYSTIAHEMNHIFQFREYLVLNTYVEPWAAKFKKRKLGNWLNRYVYFDIPYFNGFYYLLEQYDSDEPACYYSNFYEFEAERLSINKYVPRCK